VTASISSGPNRQALGAMIPHMLKAFMAATRSPVQIHFAADLMRKAREDEIHNLLPPWPG
jgi:hypothetical protein